MNLRKIIAKKAVQKFLIRQQKETCWYKFEFFIREPEIFEHFEKIAVTTVITPWIKNENNEYKYKPSFVQHFYVDFFGRLYSSMCGFTEKLTPARFWNIFLDDSLFVSQEELEQK